MSTGRKPSLTIRLKLTLWYGFVFVLAGVILIASNYYMVRNSLSIAPEKARAAVAQQFGLDPEDLEFGHVGPGSSPARTRWTATSPSTGSRCPRLIDAGADTS